MIAKLALEDGTVFTGESIGATGTRTGEVVFNTGMTGYQEIITDPSYCGQIVTMTFPLQGNYGVNPEDFEAPQPYLSGVVLRDLPRRPSNYRATVGLPEFLAERQIVGLLGVDTRALTRRIRVHGALRGGLSTEVTSDLELVELARGSASMTGANLVERVTPSETSEWIRPLWRPAGQDASVAAARSLLKKGTGSEPSGLHSIENAYSRGACPLFQQAARKHVVVIDCGIKHNIPRHLVESGCRVTMVPAGTPTEAIRELAPDGLLVSNGPGDPAAVADTAKTLRTLLGQLPIFGICLGHQLLAIALGAETYKLRFGHHGVNVPVRNQQTGRVEITSQNHGFAVKAEALERVGGTVTHVNLNDGTLEGFVHHDLGVLAVQFHPEASPGPHDAGYLFTRFAKALGQNKVPDVEALV